MIYKKTERIEEPISASGIGTWGFGGDWDTTDDNSSRTILTTAIERGVNLIDVAPVYGWGHSETVVGKILKESGLRDKVLIASKAGLLWNEKHETTNNLSRESLLWEIDQSLTRLQTDHLPDALAGS